MRYADWCYAAATHQPISMVVEADQKVVHGKHRQRQREFWNTVLFAEAALIKDMGEDQAKPLIKEAKKGPRAISGLRRVFVIATKQ